MLPQRTHCAALSFLLLGSVLLSGCSMWPWRKFKRKPVEYGVISVRLNKPSGSANTYALAFTQKKEKRMKVSAFQRTGSDGSASFVLPSDKTYNVLVFKDLNRNQEFDPPEPHARANNLKPIPAEQNGDNPVTLALGQIGPVRPGPATSKPAASPPKKKSSTLDGVPPELIDRYWKDLPPWLQQELNR